MARDNVRIVSKITILRNLSTISSPDGLEIEFCGKVAVDVVGHCFAHEVFGYVEIFRQLPKLPAAAGKGRAEFLLGQKMLCAPSVRWVAATTSLR